MQTTIPFGKLHFWETWPRTLQLLSALIAGGLTPLSLAPLNIWPLALISPALLALLLYRQDTRGLLARSFSYGLGLFGVGASWVYVSIHDFGYTGVPLAALLTGLFVAGLALLFALPFLLLKYGQSSTQPRTWLPHLLLVAAVWVIGEWSRSWFLTGFPWLYIGYSQLSTPLAGWAPLLGIFGVSLAVLLTGTFTLWLLMSRSKPSLILAPLLLSGLWLGGHQLQQIEWTQATGEPKQVALVQANIPQEKKWQPSYLETTLERYRHLSADAWSADWVIWPEAAIPLLYHQALPVLQEAHETALANNSALITGILYDDPVSGRYHNSSLGLGLATGLYHKTRLVPFGEYVPLEQWLRGAIEFFNLPASFISPGQAEQHPLQIGATRLASAICYEIVYPDLVASMASNTEVILTISNDAWFGGSWGPLQHLQMAQMRALENGRFVIRGTNNGVSAIINPQGQLIASSEQFVQQVLIGEVQGYRGQTPFMRYGSSSTLLMLAALIALAYIPRLRKTNP